MNVTTDTSLYQEAVKHFNENNFSGAESILSALLKENSSDYDILNFLGIIKMHQGNFNEAANYFSRVTGLCPYHKDAFYNMGLAFQSLRDNKSALAIYNRVIEIDQNHFDSLINIGVIYMQEEQLTEAEFYFNCCLRARPDDPAALNNLANIKFKQRLYEQALPLYIKAVQLQPDSSLFNFNLGAAYIKLCEYGNALIYLEKAVELNPEYDEALNSLAAVYSKFSRFKEAEDCILRINKSRFSKVLINTNEGVAKLLQGKIDDAIECFNTALKSDPSCPDVHFNLSSALFLKGQFTEGLKEYEWRFKRDDFIYKKLVKPLPENISLDGLKILVKDEQGLGDSIQYVRYFKFLKQKGAYTIFDCNPMLIPLFRNCSDIDRLVSRESDEEIIFDYDIHLLSLPWYFKTTLDTIPAEKKYLSADPEYIKKWKSVTGSSNKFKIGICWAGNPKHSHDNRRSCNLKNFFPLFETDNTEFYSLQKGAAVQQVKDSDYPVKNLDELLLSFSDTAAAIECMDLIISVDTSVAHLAAALGKETWLMLPFIPDWRWMLNTSSSPWYPTVKLFRQDKPDDWQNIFIKIKKELVLKTGNNMTVNSLARSYDKIDIHLDTLAAAVYPEPVSELHNEITRIVLDRVVSLFNFPANIDILDVGCGQGPALDLFSKKGFAATGITLSSEDIEVCAAKGHNVLRMDQSFLSFEANSFDLLWARHVLEHSVMPLITLMEYHRVLKPGAVLYVEVPGEGTVCRHEENPNHYSVLTQKMWLSLFTKAGFSVVDSFSIPINLKMGKDEYFGFVCRAEKNKTDEQENGQLILALPDGENFGWGICSKYIKKELAAKKSFINIDENRELLNPGKVRGKVFHALTDVNFNKLYNITGDVNIGYTFFENELTSLSRQNASQFDMILAGSTWCKNKMSEAGINNSDVLIQGIDPQLFYPSFEENSKSNLFTVFSGGKFEYRKGQDLVLKAFKIIQAKYNDIVLVNAWYNHWPQALHTMHNSMHINFEVKGNLWEEIMNNIYLMNGLDPKRIITLPLVPNSRLRDLYIKTDIALFPNRCEGGTNLVLMEYMACGKPAVASFNSGHMDILTEENSFRLNSNIPVQLYSNNALESDWTEPSVDEIVEKIEFAYNNRQLVKSRGRKAGSDMAAFTWEKTAENLLKYLE